MKFTIIKKNLLTALVIGFMPVALIIFDVKAASVQAESLKTKPNEPISQKVFSGSKVKKGGDFTFSTDEFLIKVNPNGMLTKMCDRIKDVSYMPIEQKGALIAIVSKGKLKMPNAMAQIGKDMFQLNFEDSEVVISLEIKSKKSHISLRVKEISNQSQLEAVLWGPYPTTISDIIGETIGVARNDNFAIGLQSLNAKTTGGKLQDKEGRIPGLGNTAEIQSFGSILQAFSINRTIDRSASCWEGWGGKSNIPNVLLQAKEGSIEGSSIALFGCDPSNVLNTIGEIEVNEGLPHPELNGQWVKKSPETNRAYVISTFTEDNVDKMLDYVEKSGLRSLYHEGPFESWGHFVLDKTMFPNGNEGLKRCVEKATKRNLNMGFHTLSNFITKNDPYITPVPDKQLAKKTLALLSDQIGPENTTITINREGYSEKIARTSMNTLKIGDELIKYGSVSDVEPFQLFDCQRGAFGTIATMHQKNDTIFRLLDHAYKTFFPDWNLQKEVIGNIVNLINKTGISVIGFDGHEGCYASGQGDYAMDKFALDLYNQTDHVVVNSSSRSKHFYWHINHYINWGEPWYGGFRDSQTDRRFKTQAYLERNYIPNMLGWFLLKSTTTAEDIEWMMARSAGYNAGFAMVMRFAELENNPATDELLHLINIWEQARLAGVFSPEQRERLKDVKNEFHLERYDKETLTLHSFLNFSYEYSKKILQPGEPTDTEWTYSNPFQGQLLHFRLTIKGETGKIVNPELEFNNSFKFILPKELNAGWSIVCDGSETLRIYDNKGQFISDQKMVVKPPLMRVGEQTFRFGCDFLANDNLIVNFIVRQKGKEEKMPAK